MHVNLKKCTLDSPTSNGSDRRCIRVQVIPYPRSIFFYNKKSFRSNAEEPSTWLYINAAAMNIPVSAVPARTALLTGEAPLCGVGDEGVGSDAGDWAVGGAGGEAMDGVGDGVVEGVRDGEGVGVWMGDGVGVRVGVGVGVGVGDGDGDGGGIVGVGEGEGTAVGDRVGVAAGEIFGEGAGDWAKQAVVKRERRRRKGKKVLEAIFDFDF